jgi:hypothetical protein
MVISSSSEDLLHPSPADDGFDGLLSSGAESLDGPYNVLVHPSPADGWDPAINIPVNRLWIQPKLETGFIARWCQIRILDQTINQLNRQLDNCRHFFPQNWKVK